VEYVHSDSGLTPAQVHDISASTVIVKLNLELCSCARPIAYHTPTALTDDGITAVAAGPLRRPLLDPYYRRLDPTTLIYGCCG